MKRSSASGRYGQTPATFVLSGGLNLVTPQVTMPIGMCIGASNYEAQARGYRRCDGYERFDGSPSPSAASYYVLGFKSGSAAVTAGQTITGGTSGATAYILLDAVIATGSYGGGNAAGTLVLMDVVGTFIDGEALKVSGVTKSLADGTPQIDGALDDTARSTYQLAAIARRRAAIAKPAGSGPVRGVAVYKGDIYCWRDNVGGTAGQMFKATAAGWALQSLGSVIDFNTATVAFVVGGTLTNGAGASATIMRVVQTSGTYGGGDAAGYLVVSATVGTVTAGQTITGSGGGSAKAGTGFVPITLPPGGVYDWVAENFFGSKNLERLYFANGVGYAHEWDGTTLTPIRTGLGPTLDKPTYVAAYQKHLFLAYPSGNLQISQIDDPVGNMVSGGASSLGTGYEITGLFDNANTQMIIIGNSKISVLTGTSSADFLVKDLADDSGGYAHTAQMIGSPIFVDTAGVRRMDTTQATGGWIMGTLTQLIEPLMQAKAKANVFPIGSLRSRAKSQYRVYYSDGSWLTVYLGRQNAEVMPGAYPNIMQVFGSGETATGKEILLAGDADGWVYQIDSGPDFDGTTVDAYIRLPFNFVGSPGFVKRFHSVMIGCDASAQTKLGIMAEYEFSDPNEAAQGQVDLSVIGGGGYWNDAIWDQFFWSSPVHGSARARIEGEGQNISIVVVSSTTNEDPHTLAEVTFNYSVRRMLR